jgi:hypothetical protein
MLVPPSSSSARTDAKRSKSAAAAAAAGDVNDAAGDLDDAAEGQEGEESMGERARRMGGGAAAASSGLEAPKADSVAVLLQQGLQVRRWLNACISLVQAPSRSQCAEPRPSPSHAPLCSLFQAGDDAMVEQVLPVARASRPASFTSHVYFVSQCLDVKDLKVITATVQRLPPHLIPPLLNLCIARIQARPSRAVQVLLRHLHVLTLSSPPSRAAFKKSESACSLLCGSGAYSSRTRRCSCLCPTSQSCCRCSVCPLM